MSRINSLSVAAMKAMFSSETEENIIMLLTIHDPDPTGSDYPIRLSDSFTGRLTGTTTSWAQQEKDTKEGYTTDDEVIYGVTRTVNSQTQEFIFIPMVINLPPEQETGVGTMSITINYVTPQGIRLIREYLTQPTKVTIELALASSPSTTEAEFSNFWITGATYNAQSINLQLDMISFTREPFPNFNFVPSYFPGLF